MCGKDGNCGCCKRSRSHGRRERSRSRSHERRGRSHSHGKGRSHSHGRSRSHSHERRCVKSCVVTYNWEPKHCDNYLFDAQSLCRSNVRCLIESGRNFSSKVKYIKQYHLDDIHCHGWNHHGHHDHHHGHHDHHDWD